MNINRSIVYILASITIVLMFASLNTSVEYRAELISILMTWIIFYSLVIYAYYKSKSNFWLVIAIGYFLMLLSDLYFFPRVPKVFGPKSMVIFAGIHLLLLSTFFIFYGDNKYIKYANLMVVITGMVMLPLTMQTSLIKQLSLMINLTLLSVPTISISYNGLKEFESDYGSQAIFILGLILQFIVSHGIQSTFITLEINPDVFFSIAGVYKITDRIDFAGRIIMSLSVLSSKKIK